MTSSNPSLSTPYHKGPSPGIVGAAFGGIFLAGLFPVTIGGKPAFPAPDEPLTVITAFFEARSSAVLLCAALHFGAAIPLGIFTATVVSRLRFLGVRAAGADIALVGGFLTAFTMMVSSSVLWTMTYPVVAQNAAFLQALFRMQLALGGPGFSLPFGPLLAAVSVTSGFRGTLLRSVMISGLAIAVIGELSWLEILLPQAAISDPAHAFPGLCVADHRWFLAPALDPEAGRAIVTI
jgi:hypothetical protein